MKVKFRGWVMTLIALVFLTLTPPMVASATSTYDSYNPVTNQALLNHYQCASGPIDVSTSWALPILQYTHSGPGLDPYADVKALLKEGKGYVVHQNNVGRIMVTYSASSNAYLRFQTGGARYVELVSTNPFDTYGVVVMDLWDDCTLHLTMVYGTEFSGYGEIVAYENPPVYDYQRVLLSTIDVVYPAGYEGVGIPSSYTLPDASAQYVAMGDSYSSGEGSYNYDVNGGVCHRSSDSYAFYVSDELELDAPLMAACSGAQTYDIAQDGLSGAPQRDLLDSFETEYVTITIGGNDVGFSEVLRECVDNITHVGYGCSSNTSLTDSVADRISALKGESMEPVYNDGKLIKSILQVLLEINEHAPNAKIYISGYPNLFGSSLSTFTGNSSAPGGASCSLIGGVSVSYADAQWMNGIASQLNGLISDEVQDARLSRVDVEYVSPSFSGQGHCDVGVSWLNPIIIDTEIPWSLSSGSMHPNQIGIEFGYGVPFVAKMT